MNELFNSLGLNPNELASVVTIAIAAIIGLIILRVIFRLTATLLRFGCVIVVIGVVVMVLLGMFN